MKNNDFTPSELKELSSLLQMKHKSEGLDYADLAKGIQNIHKDKTVELIKSILLPALLCIVSSILVIFFRGIDVVFRICLVSYCIGGLWLVMVCKRVKDIVLLPIFILLFFMYIAFAKSLNISDCWQIIKNLFL